MSDIPLANSYSPSTYDESLNNLTTRWQEKSDEGPVKYDQAALTLDASTVSTALKYLGDIGLIDSPKAGYYEVPDEVIDYRTKLGEVKADAKRQVVDRISGYPVYEESKIRVKIDEIKIEELAEAVGGSAQVSASESDLKKIERSIKILAEFGLFNIDEEGMVSLPDSTEPDSSEESTTDTDEAKNQNGNQTTNIEEQSESTNSDVSSKTQDHSTNSNTPPPTNPEINIEVSLELTDMDPDEAREKVDILNSLLTEHEQ